MENQVCLSPSSTQEVMLNTAIVTVGFEMIYFFICKWKSVIFFLDSYMAYFHQHFLITGENV